MPYRFRRGRGQFTAPSSRSGVAYNYAGRRVLIQGDHFQLQWNGSQVMQQVLSAIVDAFGKVSNEALEYMQRIVPIDTGALQASCFVQVTVTGGRIRVVIGAGEPYAVYVELGTSSHGAQPFIRPTYDFVLSVLPGVIKAEVASRGR